MNYYIQGVSEKDSMDLCDLCRDYSNIFTKVYIVDSTHQKSREMQIWCVSCFSERIRADVEKAFEVIKEQ